MAKKWSELPAWVRAKIAKNKQADREFIAAHDKAWAELSSPPPVGRTITVTPAGKGTPMSSADIDKELRKSADLKRMTDHFAEMNFLAENKRSIESRNSHSGLKSRSSFLDSMTDAAFQLFQSQQEKKWADNAERRRSSNKAPSCKIGKGKI